jgi:uncharacterized protein (TIGR02588 family)
MKQLTPRSRAEWITFGVAFSILAFVVTLIVVQAVGSKSPPTPVASVVGIPRESDGRFFVSIAVTNLGDKTAQNVQVVSELRIDGSSATGEQSIDFLAGHQIVDLVFVFDQDPALGELSVSVAAFTLP